MNRLGTETSPYLRQHANNPVDWYAWGDDAFSEARRLGRPVFISIGYSACHWCHVMAHESFEDQTTADILNTQFISIKVDREERPDVDAIYMEAVQALSGRGGWPLSIFTTPDGRPFFGGTYFPKNASPQVPTFVALLDAISTAWRDARETLDEQANELTTAIANRLSPPEGGTEVRPSADELFTKAIAQFREMFDAEHGGIGMSPKFPQGPMLELLLTAHVLGAEGALAMVTTTLEAMASGGIYDHLGGGFSRYSVDRYWLVPHFEKMLYDQATLSRIYLHAWQITGDRRWLEIVTETIDYTLRDLRDPSGGLWSAEDADSSGEEGLFYTWTRDEVIEVLRDDAQLIFDWYGSLERPNFEHGRSILYRTQRGDLLRPAGVENARQRLFSARTKRERPGIDDKVLTEWNAMFCSMLCEAAAATGNSTWRTAAIEIGETILGPLRRADGRFLRSLHAENDAPLAMATDYGWIVDCLTRLSELTGRSHYLELATEVADDLITLFEADGGGWYLTGQDGEGLVVRPVDSHDGVVPAAGSIAASALARLGALTGIERFTDRAARTVDATATGLSNSPIFLAHLVGAAGLIDHGAMEIVIGPGRDDLVTLVNQRFLPEAVLAWGEPSSGPLWEGRGDARAYVCRSRVCQAPSTTATELVEQIDRALVPR